MKKFVLPIIICIVCIAGIIGISAIYSDTNQKTGQSYFNGLETSPQNASTIVIGASYIKVPEKATVVTQVDRVIKDEASDYNVNTPPGQSPTNASQLVPWMEGARVAQLMEYANVHVIPITGVPIKKINGNWYGPDDHGNFIFEVDPSKTSSLFSINGSDSNNKIEINTHGMNVMVPGAIKNHAFLVVACGDLPGKAKAEMYMAAHGINCYAPCDRFTANVMGYNGTGVILGGEPIRPLINGSGAIIGAQPVAINKTERIVVQTTNETYPDQYCDTPNRYFTQLEKVYNITLNLDVVNANINQTNLIVAEAEKTGANVIGVRVETSTDKKPVEAWLKANPNHRAILFHSAAYASGYSLFAEFPDQVTGQDPKPIFIKQTSTSELEQIFNGIRSLWS
ncbi:hypothetical protein [Methanobacterium sp.]|uniref:hypothetical protein n=1 Tax=Methanobacterium sp. TaxID=2164 RepID=UPI003C721235